MIGTFYRSGGPDKDAFVKVGDRVEVGQVICIIEAMKLFNEIESDQAGTITKVLLNDASPVEYDQPLFVIE
jgi:acetyl-CoA carboxylase biotin carboxyl carrier protein